VARVGHVLIEAGSLI